MPAVAIHVDMDKVQECVRESPEWRRRCEKFVAEGVSYARSVAPVRTGRYQSSLFGQVATNTYAAGVPGAPSAMVISDSPYALEVEFQAPKRYEVLLSTLDQLMQGV